MATSETRDRLLGATIDGTQSELIVPSGHSAHQHPLAIKEVRRILLLP